MKRTGFPPVSRPDAEVLILGSLPGEESLRQGRYYAHRSNRFWWILGELIGASPELAYEARLEILVAHRIALWDVCAAAVRPGSLDAKILVPSVESNDFGTFLAAHPLVRLICFSGGQAAALFRRKVSLPAPGVATLQLPSTSPAHAAMRPEQKLALWREALGELVTRR